MRLLQLAASLVAAAAAASDDDAVASCALAARAAQAAAAQATAAAAAATAALARLQGGPTSPSGVYTVLSYGADSSGHFDSTAAIQAAVHDAMDHASNHAQSEVLFPSGTYLLRAINLAFKFPNNYVLES